jgi:hypothetical protein
MSENANCRLGGYLLGAGTLVALLGARLARASWPAQAAIAVLGLGGALALLHPGKRPAT